MSVNVVKVSGDYKIKTGDGRSITLDTGSPIGDIILNGNLIVTGGTGTLDLDQLRVKDNVITINYGETGSGVGENIAGITIDRGTAPTGNAEILWDETLLWNDPVTQTQKFGVFKFITDSGGINGIQTNSINTAGGDLYLINSGNGVISVSGTNDYEQQVLDYAAGLVPRDDDIIPNIKAVVDLIAYEILNSFSNQLLMDDTRVTVYDTNITFLISTYQTTGSSTTVRVNHPRASNSALKISLGSFVNISGSGIANLDGTWVVSQANPNDTFFNILISFPINIAPTLNVGTVIVQNIASNVEIAVDNNLIADFKQSFVNLYDIKIQGNDISTTLLNDDLVLSTFGTGNITINDVVKIPHRISDPAAESNSVKLYTKTPAVGQTGIYFRNTDYNDELISKKKAIAFSILM
jgi:hypothetical protein